MRRVPSLGRRLFVSAALTLARPAGAADLPPIRLVVPAAAGGATDLLGRLFAQYLTEDMGRQVFVDNRPGAGGSIGTEFVAKAKPDGTTLLLGALSHAINPALFEQLPYDSEKDFAPVVKLVDFASVLIVNNNIPVQNLAEFVRYAKDNPNKLVWALGALGTSQQLAGLQLARYEQIQYVTVPYRGGGPAMNDLLGGHASFMIESIPTALVQIQAKTVKALAVTGASRADVLPDVPTFAQAGVKDFNVQSWFAILGPAGLPDPFISDLYARIQKIVRRPEVKEKLASLGATLDLRSPNDTKVFIRSEMDRYIPVLKNAGVKAN